MKITDEINKNKETIQALTKSLTTESTVKSLEDNFFEMIAKNIANLIAQQYDIVSVLDSQNRLIEELNKNINLELGDWPQG